jgi:hypothetical protein
LASCWCVWFLVWWSSQWCNSLLLSKRLA